MKKINYIFFILIIILTACGASSPQKTEVFKVWGNCEKCKKTIEGSCHLDGVIEADWNIDSKLMTVKFDTTKISLDVIEEHISRAGYDNDKYYGDDYAYGKLEECCQYERKPYEMN